MLLRHPYGISTRRHLATQMEKTPDQLGFFLWS